MQFTKNLQHDLRIEFSDTTYKKNRRRDITNDFSDAIYKKSFSVT